MEHQCSLGLCFSLYDTKWGMPGFVHLKKDGSFSMANNMQEINKGSSDPAILSLL
jgi:hypothetical protein